MESLAVGELKANFSKVLEKVQKGGTIEIVFGKKRPVARIVPIDEAKATKKGKLGLLEGKMKFVFSVDFKMTYKEFVALKNWLCDFSSIPTH